MTTARHRSPVRRAEIAQAALEVLAEVGPAELSMARVAGRIGLATSALYRHFPRKDDIVDAILELIESRFEANLAEACRATDDPLERLRLLLERHLALVRTDSGIPRLFFSGETFRRPAGRGERFYALVSGYLGRVGGVIREGQRTGRIRGDVDARTLAVHFLGIVQPAAMLGCLGDGRFDVAGHARRAWKLFEETASPARRGPAGGRRKHQRH